ncbi:MAG: DNA repair protein RadA [Veillonella sp.]|nr:DNA repair protein RadA [Veillonella sp.]
MAKAKSVFFCQNCGAESSKWMGRCPQCGEWNTLVEEIIKETKHSRTPSRGVGNQTTKPTALPDIEISSIARVSTTFGEIDRVLGGGIVPGALMLLGGDPGIGKSTLLLQVSQKVADTVGTVLYASGEESQLQLKLRAERLHINSERLQVIADTDLDHILEQADAMTPSLLVIDSIQTMYTGDIDAAPGSVSQVRECTSRLLRFCKERNIPTVIIGHVTKEGNIAGPRMLEHMVDVVLYFEGERSYQFRILRSIKNRFGSTSETGIFAMVEEGLQELSNPSASLLAERSDEESGSAVMILLAVLEKRCGFTLGNKDVYVNVIGGLKVNEPACDLSMAVAIVSNLKNRIVPTDMVILGEVGLTGNVRSIPRIEQRINEAKKLGFKKFIIPEGNYKQIKDNDSSIKIRGVKSIQEAMQLVFS